jgi:hypothetical protein
MAFTKSGAAGSKDGFDPEDVNNEFSQAGADDDAPF